MSISEKTIYQLIALKSQEELYSLLNEYKEELISLYQDEANGTIADKEVHMSKKEDAQMNFQMLVKAIEVSYQNNRKVA